MTEVTILFFFSRRKIWRKTGSNCSDVRDCHRILRTVLVRSRFLGN